VFLRNSGENSTLIGVVLIRDIELYGGVITRLRFSSGFYVLKRAKQGNIDRLLSLLGSYVV